MSGPATKMREALEAVWYDDDDAFLAAVNEAWKGVTPATLEAMDAVAFLVGAMTLAQADAAGKSILLTPIAQMLPHEERAALRLLLEREIKRRSASPTTVREVQG